MTDATLPAPEARTLRFELRRKVEVPEVELWTDELRRALAERVAAGRCTRQEIMTYDWPLRAAAVAAAVVIAGPLVVVAIQREALMIGVLGVVVPVVFIGMFEAIQVRNRRAGLGRYVRAQRHLKALGLPRGLRRAIQRHLERAAGGSMPIPDAHLPSAAAIRHALARASAGTTRTEATPRAELAEAAAWLSLEAARQRRAWLGASILGLIVLGLAALIFGSAAIVAFWVVLVGLGAWAWRRCARSLRDLLDSAGYDAQAERRGLTALRRELGFSSARRARREEVVRLARTWAAG